MWTLTGDLPARHRSLDPQREAILAVAPPRRLFPYPWLWPLVRGRRGELGVGVRSAARTAGRCAWRCRGASELHWGRVAPVASPRATSLCLGECRKQPCRPHQARSCDRGLSQGYRCLSREVVHLRAAAVFPQAWSTFKTSRRGCSGGRANTSTRCRRMAEGTRSTVSEPMDNREPPMMCIQRNEQGWRQPCSARDGPYRM
jgi:hypothetical protein